MFLYLYKLSENYFLGFHITRFIFYVLFCFHQKVVYYSKCVFMRYTIYIFIKRHHGIYLNKSERQKQQREIELSYFRHLYGEKIEEKMNTQFCARFMMMALLFLYYIFKVVAFSVSDFYRKMQKMKNMVLPKIYGQFVKNLNFTLSITKRSVNKNKINKTRFISLCAM